MFLICSLSLIYPIYIPYRFLAYLSLILRWGSYEVPMRFQWSFYGDRGHIRGNILGSYKYYLIDNEFFYHINISCSASRTLCVAKRRCYVVCTFGALCWVIKVYRFALNRNNLLLHLGRLSRRYPEDTPKIRKRKTYFNICWTPYSYRTPSARVAQGLTIYSVVVNNYI